MVVLNTVLSGQLCLAFPEKLPGCQAGSSVDTKTHTRLAFTGLCVRGSDYKLPVVPQSSDTLLQCQHAGQFYSK